MKYFKSISCISLIIGFIAIQTRQIIRFYFDPRLVDCVILPILLISVYCFLKKKKVDVITISRSVCLVLFMYYIVALIYRITVCWEYSCPGFDRFFQYIAICLSSYLSWRFLGKQKT